MAKSPVGLGVALLAGAKSGAALAVGISTFFAVLFVVEKSTAKLLSLENPFKKNKDENIIPFKEIKK